MTTTRILYIVLNTIYIGFFMLVLLAVLFVVGIVCGNMGACI